MIYPLNGWYCAAFGQEVSEEPFARRILGIPIMFVRDEQGQVRAMNDRCPHRFAPLHKGKRVGDAIECPYHGLQFSFQGACIANPHGTRRIPAVAQLATYATVERDGVVWLWPGEQTLANPDDVPDLLLITEDGTEPLRGHLEMPVDYRLVLDNLLDLSHAAYLHAGTLSPAAGRVKREANTEVEDRSIMVRARVRDVTPPSSLALYCPDTPGDFQSQIEWRFPGTMRHGLSMTKPGADFESGIRTRNAHLITPESEQSTHYFWIHTREAKAGDPQVDAATRTMLSNAFLNEDEPMMRACQEYMDGQEFFSLKPLYLDTDAAGTRCRRIMERIVEEEQAERSATCST